MSLVRPLVRSSQTPTFPRQMKRSHVTIFVKLAQKLKLKDYFLSSHNPSTKLNKGQMRCDSAIQIPCNTGRDYPPHNTQPAAEEAEDLPNVLCHACQHHPGASSSNSATCRAETAQYSLGLCLNRVQTLCLVCCIITGGSILQAQKPIVCPDF